MRMPNQLLGEVNAIRQNIGQNPLKTNEITAYKNAVNNHLNKRVLEGMSPETVAHIAADSFINPYSKALPVDNNGAYDRNHIQMAVSGNPDGKYNTTTFSQFGDNIILKNITPRKSAEIKNLLQRREDILNGSSDGGAGVVPSSTNVGGAPFSAGRTTYADSIAQNTQKVNNGYQYSYEIRNKIDQNLDERLLRVRDNTGETLADFETRLKREGATEREIEPYKNSFIRRAKIFLEEPGSMPGWSLDQENTQNNETNLADFNFQPSTINENTKLYHGTNGKVAEEIRKNGFKRGNELDENAYFGGGHDVMSQDSVSFSTNRNVSEDFAINGRDSGKGSGALIEARLLPDARVVETDAEIYAEDLNEVTEQLRKQGVDAVFLKKQW